MLEGLRLRARFSSVGALHPCVVCSLQSPNSYPRHARAVPSCRALPFIFTACMTSACMTSEGNAQMGATDDQ